MMQTRYLLFVSVLFIYLYGNSQIKNNLSIGLESNSQYYVDDSVTGDFNEENPFRSNNYLKVDYGIGNFNFGIQAESYAPQHLLNYSPKYDQTINLGTYFANYTNDKIDLTLGYFYEQFGSGLVLRSWEDRQLGINNAIRGVKMSFHPTDWIDLTALYGNQRVGFKVSEGTIAGLNTDFNLSKNETTFILGTSFVNKHQDLNTTNGLFRPDVQLYSYRMQFAKGNIYANIEGVWKSKDAYIGEGIIYEDNLFYGNALQWEFGFSKSGLGITTTLRRMENMSIYSDREATGNLFNEQILNYLPGLTKQHDYTLTNLYVYQAQPGLSMNASEQKAGEIGGQIDIYYKFKKGTTLGGKYGTKIAANYSNWFGLKADYNTEFKRANIQFLGKGDLYFRDANIEIRKKFSKKISGIVTYVNSTYNKEVIEGEDGMVKSNVLVAETTYKISRKRSIRAELQHLWTKDDLKNWVAGTAEFNINSHLSFFANDMYNYGEEKDHYFNLGGSYSVNKSRFALSYGRTRGGLLCVGGVCRIVPAATGLTFNITTSF
jgi:hypothetical protein